MIELMVNGILGVITAIVGLSIGFYFGARITEKKRSSLHNPDLVPFLEEIEPEKSSPETRVLQILEETSEPLTYTQLQKRIPALTTKEVKDTIKSLRSKGTISVREAGKRGRYYYVQDLQGLSDE